MSDSATITERNKNTVVSDELQALRDYVSDTAAFKSAGALLGWDEKTKLPPKGAADRGRQKAAIAGLLHERSTSDTYRGLIEAAEASDPGNRELRSVRRGYDMSTKLPTEFVRELTLAASAGGHAWEQARAKNDFETFAPHLEKLLDLCRQEADYFGYENEQYDALLDIYEQGMTAQELEPLFEGLREPTLELMAKQPEPDTSILERLYPLELQTEYSNYIVKHVGYDLEAGRIDPTAHPFCSSIGRNDVRLTTRFDEHWLPGSVFATIHEAGHGIYEQAFDRLELPSTIASAPGLGMHESQSRMFENIVARSHEFWQFHYARLQTTFPDALGDVDVDAFHRAINVSKPSLIRVEADELTYNLHIGVRFELERKLVNGDLKVRDLPEAWKDGMQRWVGIVPETNADGVLQDVHWSMGSFGYFPTYTLGNVYSSQFVEVARKDLGDLDGQLKAGNVRPLRDWFDEHVYQYGSSYTGREFVERITGGPISVEPLVRYLRSKFDS